MDNKELIEDITEIVNLTMERGSLEDIQQKIDKAHGIYLKYYQQCLPYPDENLKRFGEVRRAIKHLDIYMKALIESNQKVLEHVISKSC